MAMSTPKQIEAQARNFNIKRLRGMAAQARIIPMCQSARNRILMGVDQALRDIGADSESEHARKVREKWEADLDEIANNPNL